MELRRRTITTERAGMGISLGRIIPYCCAHTETSESSFRVVQCAPEQQVSYRRKVSFFWKVTPPPGDARPDRNPGAKGIVRLLKGLEIFPGKKGKFRKVVNHFALRPGKGWSERNPALRGNSFGVGHGPDTKTPDGVFDPLPRAPPGLARGGPLEPRYTTHQLTYQNDERMVTTMKNKTVNRTRNRSVTFRMNESEYEAFSRKLKETGLTQQTFLMGTVQQAVILSEDGLREMKDINLKCADLLRQIKGMANNINQMARWANTTGILPTEWQLYEIGSQLDDFRERSEQIWQSIRSLTTQQ